MRAIRMAFTGIIAGLIALATPGQALPAPAPEPHPAVCDTGFRGQPDYDRRCLITGDRATGRDIWTDHPLAARMHQCRAALTAGLRTVIIESRGDVIRDTYRNDRQMIRWATAAGVAECSRRMR